MNTIEKILQSHSTEMIGSVAPGDIIRVNVDLAVMLDMAGVHPEFLRNPPKNVFDPRKVAIVFDHLVPAPTTDVADGTRKLRILARKWGISHFYDYGRGGISHALLAQEGLVKPGNIIANTDSHTIAMGAYNSIGRGLGMPELMQVLCTGQTWFIVSPTIRVELEGHLNAGVEAKDIFLRMASEMEGTPEKNIEFYGSGVAGLSIEERAEVSTMCAELGSEFASFPFDARLQAFMENKGIRDYRPVYPDNDATYHSEYTINLSDLEPLVARPDSVINNVSGVGELEGTQIDQATIGSCANGTLSDLASAATILKGRKIAENVRLIVTPATQKIYQEALERGYIEAIVRAGGIVTNSTCGSCFGGHMGVVGDNDVVITSTTRNFKGRMGSRNARIYMASSATVAASAITGSITDPRDFIKGDRTG